MSSGLAKALFAEPPRESLGGPSANRHAYHHTWAVCHLLNLHADSADYLLVLEFHDDVLVLEPAKDPQHADFFQVKTKREGNWTQSALLRTGDKAQKQKTPPSTTARRRSKTPNPAQMTLLSGEDAGSEKDASPRSILGKLLDHVRRFPEHVRTLNLVSNVPFEVDLCVAPESKDREKVCLRDLNPTGAAALRDAIRAELSLPSDPPLDKVFLIVTGIGLTEHEVYGAGKLAAFLESRHPDKRFRSSALFRNLLGEIGRRANAERKPADYADLLKSKGISRRDFDEWIQGAVRDDPEEKLAQVRQRLDTERADVRLVQTVEKAWREYVVARTDHADVVLQAFIQQVQRSLARVMAQSFADLRDLLRLAENDFVASFGEPKRPLSRNLLKGAILYEFKATEAGELSAPGSERPTEER